MGLEAGYNNDELLACVVARELRDGETIAIGTSSPVPASAAYLAKFTHAPSARLFILGSARNFPFRGGSKEFFDFAQRGRLDVFFLGGAQIDVRGNINLHCIGDYAAPKVRLPGARGSAMLYYMARRVLLFTGEHTPRVFVERVDFITSPGSTSPAVYRFGGPDKVITPLCVMRFNPETKQLELGGLNPGLSLDEVQQQTGFPITLPANARPETPPRITPPTPEELEMLRSRVRREVAEVYPRFAAERLGAP